MKKKSDGIEYGKLKISYKTIKWAIIAVCNTLIVYILSGQTKSFIATYSSRKKR